METMTAEVSEALFEEKVALTPRDLAKGELNVEKTLREKLATALESKCSLHGYVLPDTMEILSRSVGYIEKGRYTGDIVFLVQAKAKVLNPADHTLLVGEVLRQNKMGMYVNYKDAIRIILPRDLHLGNEEFDRVQVGQQVEVEIKKSRFQVNDEFILSVGLFRRVVGAGAPPAPAQPQTTLVSKVAESEEEEEEEVEEEEKAAQEATEAVEEEEKSDEEDEEELEESAPASASSQPASASSQQANASSQPTNGSGPPAGGAGAAASVSGPPASASSQPTATEPVSFYSNLDNAYKPFSNFHLAPLSIDGKTYPSVEHYFQAMKFPTSPEYQETIRTAKTPAKAKTLGSTRDKPLRNDWNQVREQVMMKALRAKFSQHPALKQLLLSTGDRKLVEASKADSYWGSGRNGKGKNRLGELLTQLRTELRSSGNA